MASKTTNKEDVTSTVTEELVANQNLATAKRTADADLRAALADKKRLGAIYMAEEKIPVSIPPFYAAYMGKVHTLTINGISVCIPADGKTYKIPKSFACALKRKLANVDAIVAKGKKLGDVHSNSETFAGELRF